MENLVKFFSDESLWNDADGGMATGVLFIAILIMCFILALLGVLWKIWYTGKIAPVIEPVIAAKRAARIERKENLIIAKAEKITEKRTHRAANAEWNALTAECAQRI